MLTQGVSAAPQQNKFLSSKEANVIKAAVTGWRTVLSRSYLETAGKHTEFQANVPAGTFRPKVCQGFGSVLATACNDWVMLMLKQAARTLREGVSTDAAAVLSVRFLYDALCFAFWDTTDVT